MLMLVSMTLTLMQGHSGSAKAKIQQKVISIKLVTMVGHFLRDLDFANVYMACPYFLLCY